MSHWRTWLLLACLIALPALGCGTKELGPANPDETPKVDEAEIQATIERGMPAEYRQKYQNQK